MTKTWHVRDERGHISIPILVLYAFIVAFTVVLTVGAAVTGAVLAFKLIGVLWGALGL